MSTAQPPPGPPHAPPPAPPRRSLLWLWLSLGVAVALLAVSGAVLLSSGTDAADDYRQRSKRSEAELNLSAIGKSARVSFIENAAVPTGAAPLTPSTPCCEHGPQRRCLPDMRQWDIDAWADLDFAVTSPHYFRYSYQPAADGQSFVATAVGDLDCDGTEVVFTLRGEVVNGDLVLLPIERPTNRD